MTCLCHTAIATHVSPFALHPFLSRLNTTPACPTPWPVVRAATCPWTLLRRLSAACRWCPGCDALRLAQEGVERRTWSSATWRACGHALLAVVQMADAAAAGEARVAKGSGRAEARAGADARSRSPPPAARHGHTIAVLPEARQAIHVRLAASPLGAMNTESGPFQFALQARAGTDCLAHTLRAALELDPEAVVISLDGRGAYNSISRAAFLSKLQEVAPSVLPFARAFYARRSTY